MPAGKTSRKGPLWRTKCRWTNNIEMYFYELGLENVVFVSLCTRGSFDVTLRIQNLTYESH